MAVTSLGERCKERFSVTCSIGSSIQLKYLVKESTENQCLDDQVCPYKCPNRTSDQWDVLDIVEELRRYSREPCEAFLLPLRYSVRLFDQDVFARYAKIFDQDAFAIGARLLDQDTFISYAKLFDQDAFIVDTRLLDREALPDMQSSLIRMHSQTFPHVM
ncbi:hypothetical protein Fot_28769 [Forsythia ovata]|uniref:Uncharacterized protein n=1 Tax=Forsythia ovata TaxID=205694 RepID=A0ABD1TPY3_9LAMI